MEGENEENSTCVTFNRREIFDAVRHHLTAEYGDKEQRVEVFISKKIGRPFQCHEIDKVALKNLFHTLKTKWSDCNRMVSRFEEKNKEWFKGTIQLQYCQSGEDLKARKRKNDSTSLTSRGRPSGDFEKLSDRSKRRRSGELLKACNTAELAFATSMSLRLSGAADAASIVKDITTSSPSCATKYKAAYKASDQPECKEISADLALSDLVEGKMTKKTYQLIRNRELKNHAKVYPSYHKVSEAKSRCYPLEINATETLAEVPLQSLLHHITKRLLFVQNDVIVALSQKKVRNLELTAKYGFDGSSGQKQYKQKFENENASDESVLLTSLVPLRLTSSDDKNVLLWQNPKPSSPRFCSPIKLQCIRENVTSTLNENSYVEDQITKLSPYVTFIDGKEITVNFKLIYTMIDGKVRNTITMMKSNMRCYLCGATSKTFNDLDAVCLLPVNEQHLRYGLATLHAWIHFMEYFLHLGYKLDTKKWQARSLEDKEKVKLRKQNIQKGFKLRFGLLVDAPKVGGFGNSNDGNTARRFFANSSESAQILGLDAELLNRAHIVMQVLSCGYAVNVELFKAYCLETAKMLVGSFPWYCMPTSIHEVLIHGPLIIEWAPLPIGQLSEEAQESRNKDVKKYREHNSRKNSRNNTIRDVFQWLIVSSDPIISSLRTIPPKKGEGLSHEAIQMLSSYVPGGSESSDSDDSFIDYSD